MEEATLEVLLTRCGEQLINIYRKKLSQYNANASGTLGNSLNCFVQYDSECYELFIQIQDYWKCVEYGRKPGSFPNVNALIKWIQVKPVLPRPYKKRLPSQESLAFLIGRKIKNDGIPAKPLLAETLEELDKMQIIEQRIDEKIKDDITVTFNTLK